MTAAAAAPSGALPRDVAQAAACPGAANSERFLMSYYPRPPKGGKHCRRMRSGRGVPQRRAAPRVHRGLGQGRGTVGARCLEHGALSCDLCCRMRCCISWCCRAGHAGHERDGEAAAARPPVQPRRGPGLRVLTLQMQWEGGT